MEDWADLAVERLVADILDRRGLKHEFARIDPDVKAELRKEWATLLREAHAEAFALGLGAG